MNGTKWSEIIKMAEKQKVIVICGPTASGKTAMSIELAKKINGEIISADSMQIYKDMNIGTAKPTIEEMQGIKHYLLDFVSPNERYSVAQYKQDAKNAIKEIILKGKVPIIVGGTGLYIDSLIYEIEYNDINIDENYRKELEKIVEEQGLEKLYEEAIKIDSEAMKKISKNDKKRIMRVLEIYQATGKTKTQQEKESRKKPVEYDYEVFAINWDRQVLYERINKRVDIMIKQGLVQEVQYILDKYETFPTAMQGLGYKEVVDYINGKYTKNEMIEKIKMETRRYAKRQLTWFRKNKETVWINGENGIEDNINIIVNKCMML
jgi:tRNA dimethylallyltransferase